MVIFHSYVSLPEGRYWIYSFLGPVQRGTSLRGGRKQACRNCTKIWGFRPPNSWPPSLHSALGCMVCSAVPSGELTFCHGKSPFLMGKSTISMAIFNGKMLVHQRVDIVDVILELLSFSFLLRIFASARRFLLQGLFALGTLFRRSLPLALGLGFRRSLCFSLSNLMTRDLSLLLRG